MIPFSSGVRLLFLLLLTPVFLIIPACANPAYKKVCIKNTCLLAQIAETPQAKAAGLMFRESLGDNEGMLFIYAAPAQYGFWMKNMRLPLDFIWIGKDHKVAEVTKNVPPCGSECNIFSSQVKAQYVLEVKAGFIDKYGIKVGDPVSF